MRRRPGPSWLAPVALSWRQADQAPHCPSSSTPRIAAQRHPGVAAGPSGATSPVRPRDCGIDHEQVRHHAGYHPGAIRFQVAATPAGVLLPDTMLARIVPHGRTHPRRCKLGYGSPEQTCLCGFLAFRPRRAAGSLRRSVGDRRGGHSDHVSSWSLPASRWHGDWFQADREPVGKLSTGQGPACQPGCDGEASAYPGVQGWGLDPSPPTKAHLGHVGRLDRLRSRRQVRPELTPRLEPPY